MSNNIKGIHLFRITKWLIAYVSLLFGTALFVLVLTTFPDFFNGYTLYPLVRSWDALKSQLACLIIPISIAVIMLVLLSLNIKGITRPLIVATLLGANIMACCARFTGLALENHEQANIIFRDHLYNLIISASTFGPNDKQWINLYECDTNNFLCRIIVEKYVSSTNAKLITDEITSTIAIQINGETLYVHPVK